MLPTFVVIGAMKSGTTSLYYYLRAHPEIGMSAMKETDFFIEQNNYARGVGWYRSLFDGTRRVRGEVSPNYAKCHLFPDVPARMAALLPEVKLVYLLRDPVERAVSHYGGSYALGRERRAPSAMVEDLDASNYVQTSRYFMQLDAYLHHYPPSHVHVETSWNLRHRRRQTLRRLYRFIGVDPDFYDSTEHTKVLNRSAAQKHLPAWLRFVSDRLMSQRSKDWLRPFVPPWLVPGRRLDLPPIDAPFRQRLSECLRDDVQKLRLHTGRAFSHWSL